MSLTLLAGLWCGWCLLHSLLIDRRVSHLLASCFPRHHQYGRLLYNCLALATVAPLVVATLHQRGPEVFRWSVPVLRYLLLLIALLLFYSGARAYDFAVFLGLRQLRAGRSYSLLNPDPAFTATGVFALVRHPWYLASLLLLWSIFPVYHQQTVLVAALLSLYLVVGSYLEEQKILHEFGPSYRAYQQQVSMLLPWKWLLRRAAQLVSRIK